MSPRSQCQQCGAPLPESTLQGLCPHCVARQAAGILSAQREQVTIKVQSLEETPDEGVGSAVDRYKILENVGEGGCGVVYVAEQTEPVRRRVALKVIKLGMDTKQVVARFEAERQALAMMDHPNIAKVLDAGSTDTGRPYFVMELVRGIKITEYCDQNNLPITERLDLFIKVCQAIQHAHQKGIIHRDIKPSNILVTLHDGLPVPKVIDFGIAKATEGKLTDATVYTQLHQFIGTPAYMSPEQAEMSGLDIDTRSDIYSLGVLLYELLSGRTPFDANELAASGIDAMRKTIREKEALRPSTRLATLKGEELTTTAKRRSAEAPKLIHLLKGDLDWIVMKCLEKDRTRRYETANGLAADLKRHLTNEPVVARPPSQLYRLRKLARRNRTAFIAATAVSAALVIGSIISAWQAIRATMAQRRAISARLEADRSRASAEESARKAIESERSAQRLLYAGDMALAHKAWEEGNLSRVISLLDSHRPKPGETDARGFEYFYLQDLARGEQQETLHGHTNPVPSVAVSPDGKWLASRGVTDTRLWDLQRLSLVAAWPALFPRDEDVRFPNGIQFSLDSRYLALESESGLQLYEIRTRQTRPLATGRAEQPIFSPVTNWIAFNSEADGSTRVQVWDYLADKPVGVVPDRSIWCWSPDGARILTGAARGTEGRIEWWDVAASLFAATNFVGQYVYCAAVSPDGRLTAAADWQGEVWLLETIGGRTLGSIPSGDIRTYALAFSPDARFLATASRDQAIQIWDVESRTRVRHLRGHQGKVTSLAYTPDGQLLVSGGMDGSVMLWDVTREVRQQQIPNNLRRWGQNPPHFSVDGKWLALDTGRGGESVSIFDASTLASTLQPRTSLRGEFAAFSPDSRQVAVVSSRFQEPVLRISDFAAPSPRATVRLDLEQGYHSNPRVSPDGTILVLGGLPDDGCVLFDATTGESLLRVRSRWGVNQFLSDGRTFVCADGFSINFWDLRSRQKTRSLRCDGGVVSLCVSSDDRFLAASRWDLKISLWDLSSGTELGPLAGHQAFVMALAFSPDGRALASGSEDRSIKLWDLATRRELATYPQEQAVYVLSFSPDGQMLVSGGIGSYHFWQAPRSDPLITPGAPRSSPDILPTNSLWRIPDGPAALPRMIAEKEQCFSNLAKIHAAIMAYRKEHQRMPDWLGDLIPAYLSETNCLICPVQARTRHRPEGLWTNDLRIRTSYAYQFSARTNTSADRYGLAAPGDTMKAWRTKQLERYGDTVPVLRCALHSTMLYLTYAGERLDHAGERPEDSERAWRSAAYMNLRAKDPEKARTWCRKIEQEANAYELENLAWRWATSESAEERDGEAAVRFAEKAVALTNRKDADFVATLAAAYAELGQFDKAASVQLEANTLLRSEPQWWDQIREFEERLALYRQHAPWRD